MARLEINGQRIEVDDSFLQLSPEQQQMMVNEIAGSLAPADNAPNGRTQIGESGGLKIYESGGVRMAVGDGYSTSDPAKIDEIMAGADYRDLLASDVNQERIAQAGYRAPLGEVVRGSMLGSFADEAYGALYGDEAKERQRRTSEAYRAENPGKSLGLNILGAGVEAAAAAPLAVAGVAKTIGQGPRVAQVGRGLLGGAAVGGATGALYGAGEGTDTASRLQEAQSGGLLGAAAGGAIGGGVPLFREGVENVARLFRRSDISQISRQFGISADAAKVIKNTFDQGGDVNAALANLQRGGSEAMLADAGPAAQALLDAVNASGGDASRIVRDAIGGRMGRTRQAVEGVMDATLGQPADGPMTAIAEISQRTAPQRSAAYDAAYGAAIDYSSDAGKQIDEVISRIPPRITQSAIADANEEMVARGLQNEQIMATIADDGTVSFTNPPNVRQLDALKRSLQDVAQGNTNDFGQLNAAGQRYNDLARELRDAVRGAVPEYGEALQQGGDAIAERNAFELGRDLLRTRTEIEDVRLLAGQGAPAAQAEAAKRGMRTHLNKMLGDVRAIASDPTAEAVEAREVFKAIAEMSSANSREKIRILLGDDALPLLAQIDEAAQAAMTASQTARNSATASRIAQSEMINEVTSPGMLGQAAQGELVGTSKALIQSITGQTGEYTAARKQQIYADIARALTQDGGDQARTALAVLTRAMEGQALTDAQTNQLAQLIASTLGQTAAGAARPNVTGE